MFSIASIEVDHLVDSLMPADPVHWPDTAESEEIDDLADELDNE